MKEFTNYRYFVSKNKVIAVSTFAGRTVRGVAICSPSDKFNLETGKTLAAARCNEKVAAKRFARAQKNLAIARKKLESALIDVGNMNDYCNDAYMAYNEAAQKVDSLMATL